MPFTIDTDLIENDEVRLTENDAGNLDILHVPSGKLFEIDSSEKSSSITSEHSNLSGIGSSDHHTRYSDSEASNAAPVQSVNGETGDISISGFSGSHTDLTDIGSSDHHTRYSDSEAISAVEGQSNLQLSGDLTIAGTITENNSM